MPGLSWLQAQTAATGSRLFGDALADPTSGVLYIFGGLSLSFSAIGGVSMYDTAMNTLLQLVGPLNPAAPAAVVAGALHWWTDDVAVAYGGLTREGYSTDLTIFGKTNLTAAVYTLAAQGGPQK